MRNDDDQPEARFSNHEARLVLPRHARPSPRSATGARRGGARQPPSRTPESLTDAEVLARIADLRRRAEVMRGRLRDARAAAGTPATRRIVVVPSQAPAAAAAAHPAEGARARRAGGDRRGGTADRRTSGRPTRRVGTDRRRVATASRSPLARVWAWLSHVSEARL